MKRLIVSFFAAFMAVTVFAGDYEPGDKVFIKISVDAVQEKFFVGPYAKYAQKYLGVEARQTSSASTWIESVRMEAVLSGQDDEFVFNFGSHMQ